MSSSNTKTLARSDALNTAVLEIIKREKSLTSKTNDELAALLELLFNLNGTAYQKFAVVDDKK